MISALRLINLQMSVCFYTYVFVRERQQHQKDAKHDDILIKVGKTPQNEFNQLSASENSIQRTGEIKTTHHLNEL